MLIACWYAKQDASTLVYIDDVLCDIGYLFLMIKWAYRDGKELIVADKNFF